MLLFYGASDTIRDKDGNTALMTAVYFGHLETTDVLLQNGLPPDGRDKHQNTPLMVAALLWSLSFGVVYAVWGNYMVEGIGYTSAQMTRLWAIASLSEFPLMILAGWLSDRVVPMSTGVVNGGNWSWIIL